MNKPSFLRQLAKTASENFAGLKSRLNNLFFSENRDIIFKKAEYKLIMSFSLLVVACIAAAILSFGWFAENKNVAADNFSLNSSTPQLYNLELNSYYISSIEQSGDNQLFHIAKTESGELMQSSALPVYDKYGIEKNKYETALAVKITFFTQDTQKNYRLSALTDQLFNVLDSNYISNCALITNAQISDDTSYLTAGNTTVGFVSTSVSTGAPEKTSSIDILSFAPISGENTIWLIIEYNSWAVDYIIANNTQTQTSSVSFQNDILFNLSEVQ